MTYLTSKQIEILKDVLESLAIMDIPADFIAGLSKYIDRSAMHLVWNESDTMYTSTFYDYDIEIEKTSDLQFIPRIKLAGATIFEGAPTLMLETAERMIALHIEDIE